MRNINVFQIIIIWKVISTTILTHATHSEYQKTIQNNGHVWNMTPKYRHTTQNGDESTTKRINIMEFIMQRNNISQTSNPDIYNTSHNDNNNSMIHNETVNNNSTALQKTPIFKFKQSSNNKPPPIGHLQYGGNNGQIFPTESDYGSRINPNNGNVPSSQFPQPLPPICDNSGNQATGGGRVCPSAGNIPGNAYDESGRRNPSTPGNFLPGTANFPNNGNNFPAGNDGNNLPTGGTYPGSGIPFQGGNTRPYGGGHGPTAGGGGAGNAEPGGTRPTYGYGTTNSQPHHGTSFPQGDSGSRGPTGPYDHTENNQWNRGNAYPSQGGSSPSGGNNRPTTTDRRIPQNGNNGIGIIRPDNSGTGTYRPTYGGSSGRDGYQPGTTTHGIGPTSTGDGSTFGTGPTTFGTGYGGAGPTVNDGSGLAIPGRVPIRPGMGPTTYGSGQSGRGPTTYGTDQGTGQNIPQRPHGTVPTGGFIPDFPGNQNGGINPQPGRPVSRPSGNSPGNINPDRRGMNPFGNSNGRTNPNFPNDQFTPPSSSGRGQGARPPLDGIPQGGNDQSGGAIPGSSRRPNWGGGNNNPPCVDQDSITTNDCGYTPQNGDPMSPGFNPSIGNRPTSGRRGRPSSGGGTNRRPSNRGNGFGNTNRPARPNESPENEEPGPQDRDHGNIPQDGIPGTSDNNGPRTGGNRPHWSQGGTGTGIGDTGRGRPINPDDYDNHDSSDGSNPDNNGDRSSSGRRGGPRRRPAIGTDDNDEDNDFGRGNRRRPGINNDGRDSSEEGFFSGRDGRRKFNSGDNGKDTSSEEDEEDYFGGHNGRRRKPKFGISNNDNNNDRDDDSSDDHDYDENNRPESGSRRGGHHHHHTTQNGRTPHNGHGSRNNSKGFGKGWKHKKKYGLHNDNWFMDDHKHDTCGKCHSNEDDDDW